MTLYYIAVYHNADSRFFPYEPGHALTKVLSHWRHLPAETSPEEIAEQVRFVLSIDLDYLQAGRGKGCAIPTCTFAHSEADGEMDFLLACTFRLLGLGGLGSGDVVGITANEITIFLAVDDRCSPFNWRRINPPQNITGHGLTAEALYEHLSRGNRG